MERGGHRESFQVTCGPGRAGADVSTQGWGACQTVPAQPAPVCWGVADMTEMIQTCKTRADFLEEVMYEGGFEGPCLGGWYKDTWQGTQEEVPGAGWHWSVGSEKPCPRLGEDRPWQRRGRALVRAHARVKVCPCTSVVSLLHLDSRCPLGKTVDVTVALASSSLPPVPFSLWSCYM